MLSPDGKPCRSGRTLHWSAIKVTAVDLRERNSTGKSLFCGSKKPPRTKDILRNVSGMASPGRMLAIMGSSGAGKTTLLNVLTSRGLGGASVQGTVLVDGQPVNKWRMREISAFVQQHDMFVGTLTVTEHLQFMAKLRMGFEYTEWERQLRVEQVMSQMGLTKCANTLIGIPNVLKGLSCGEQKRLAFASEILTRPSILFCDEPTSGLDSFMAGQVVKALQTLASEGMTVVLTIHQPSTQVFNIFDDLCLMACGRIIYLGAASEAASVFERCGHPVPDYFNPADHLVSTLAIDGDPIQAKRNIASIRETFLLTPAGAVMQQISRLDENKQRTKTLTDSLFGEQGGWCQRYEASYWCQLLALTWRAWITVARDPMLMNVRLAQVVITAVLTGMVYWGTVITPASVLTINGILFNHIRGINFMLQFPAVPVLTSELPIVLRENANRVYGTGAYFVAKNVAELPQYIILPALYMVIVTCMSGPVAAFSTYAFTCLVCILVANVAISISYAVATVFAVESVAMALLPIFAVPMMAFGGFFITPDAIPPYFRWMAEISYFRFSYEAMAVNQWNDVKTIPGCNSSMHYSHDDKMKCPINGREVLENMDFEYASMWWDAGMLVVMIVLIRFVSFAALFWRSCKNN